MHSPENPILIAYDGSEAARHAIEHAARLFPGMPAVVVTAWTFVGDAAGAARAALPQGVISEAVRNLDAAAEESAEGTAREGAAHAREAGLRGSALTVRASPSVWASIVAVAEQQQARAVVVGSRGKSKLQSAVLGSVSNAIVQHCGRPVLVVHPTQ